LTAFLVRRVTLAFAVLLVVSFGTFVLMATKFTSTCQSAYTPTLVMNPPLASNAGEAGKLYWHWLRGVPSGRSFGLVCGGQTSEQIWPALGHTMALLGATALVVVSCSLLIGTIAATRAGSALDALLRGFSYAGWAVPSFVLALMLQSVLGWASSRYGFRWFSVNGWPGSCVVPGGLLVRGCATDSGGLDHVIAIGRHLVVPAFALAVAFVGLHSRYLRSSLLVALNAPYTTTARAKGLPERSVLLRHALRNSLATFASALLLDFGAIFGAAMAVDWIFQLNGLGSLLITEVAGSGSGDGPRALNPYAIETLLTVAAALVVLASLLAEVVVIRLDPRAQP
jgi:peptide/nickel transport system permease protein